MPENGDIGAEGLRLWAQSLSIAWRESSVLENDTTRVERPHKTALKTSFKRSAVRGHYKSSKRASAKRGSAKRSCLKR